MFERLVVAFDASDQASAAAQLAFAFTNRGGVEITLAHVVELPDLRPEPPQQAAIERLIELNEQDWRRRLQDVARGAPDGTPVETEVLFATKPASALLELLERRRADVVFAGTHGVGGVKRTIVGSVSQQLLEHAPCSVLLVREHVAVDAAPGVVVAGLDGSAATVRVVAMAERAAAALSAQLVLAHIVDEHLPFASIDVTHALREWARGQGEQILKAARSRVAAPLDMIEEELREGRVAHELVSLCEERQPLLAVVGTRGLHGFKGLLLGSTARALVNNAPCAVLVVRPPTDGDSA